ncbi:FkbM family methyltransferase [Bradyrhizobium sp. 930_D9_N1_4]|uniref:FkbM family methyltransferase n=1 Tax=Bradyrhizobium sp. 930_D9_N1_4 TaxID=3240374 RepID=UPI003F8A6FBE
MSERTRFLWRALRSRFRDHRAELSAILNHVRPGDIVCDVGANKGSFLYWLSRWSAHGRAVAFEPQQDLADYLTRMCAVLPLQNVTIEAKAVFSQTGRGELFVPKGHKPGASLSKNGLSYATIETVPVPVVALDDYFSTNDRISVVKIDVEGAEIGVFEGAERIVKRDKPLLVFECESRHLVGRSISDVFLYLEKLGYRGSFIQRGRVFPVSQFREDVHQSNDGQWFWKKADYCSNFIFNPVK